jgi:hypothetical protein
MFQNADKSLPEIRKCLKAESKNCKTLASTKNSWHKYINITQKFVLKSIRSF